MGARRPRGCRRGPRARIPRRCVGLARPPLSAVSLGRPRSAAPARGAHGDPVLRVGEPGPGRHARVDPPGVGLSGRRLARANARHFLIERSSA